MGVCFPHAPSHHFAKHSTTDRRSTCDFVAFPGRPSHSQTAEDYHLPWMSIKRPLVALSLRGFFGLVELSLGIAKKIRRVVNELPKPPTRMLDRCRLPRMPASTSIVCPVVRICGCASPPLSRLLQSYDTVPCLNGYTCSASTTHQLSGFTSTF